MTRTDDARECFARWCAMPVSAFDASWLPIPLIEWDKGITGVAMLKGYEIHFAVSPDHRHRVIQRHRTREFLQPMFDRLGFLTSRNDPANRTAHRFLTRLGFAHTWNDGRFDHYMLSALPFGKET